VDGRESSLSFDNMQDRPIKGDSDWRAYSIVLDVPEQATGIAYGVLLAGAGSVWMDGASFEVVDQTVPTTGTGRGTRPTAVPTNLDFEP
jgi:hypothetical protein